MTANPSTRWQSLERLAKEREDAQVQRVAERALTLSEHERRLIELNRYLDEYLAPPARPMPPALLCNREDFVRRLRDAIAAERRNTDAARAALTREQQLLVECSRETVTVTRLSDNERQRHERAQEARVQEQHDELAARRAVVRQRVGEEG